jgi:DNA-binding CsgD family transcriptional regulator
MNSHPARDQSTRHARGRPIHEIRAEDQQFKQELLYRLLHQPNKGRSCDDRTPGRRSSTPDTRPPRPARDRVGPIEALTRPTYQTKRLLDLAQAWPDAPVPSKLRSSSPRTARQLCPTEVDELVTAYQAGATVYDLATRFEVHRNTIAGHLRTRGINTRPPALTTEQAQEAANLYRSGQSLAKVAAKYDISPHGVSNYLRAAGVRLRGRHEHLRKG